MAVLIFWNVARRANPGAIARLCLEYGVDILLLAEAEDAAAGLATEINEAAGWTRMLWELPRLESRVRAFTRYPPGYALPAFDDRHVKMLNLTPPIGVPMLIVAAHLPSKLRAEHEDQAYRLRRLRLDIEVQEARNGHQNTLVIGDLNVDPFEDALTAADGLHGVMDKTVAMRPARMVQGKRWDYFYNPMWSRLGDDSVGPPGTYWHPRSGLISRYWHTFDQALLRPGLLPYFKPADLVIPEQVADTAILARRITEVGLSDHLPLVITLEIERGVGDG
jgi:endonuclease/exonuclease/phosphatase family metal-dependent hydrolase